jgi:putative transposase
MTEIATKPAGVTPYWNADCAASSRALWLPAATDRQGSPLALAEEWSSVTLDQSWFFARLQKPPEPTAWCKITADSREVLRQACEMSGGDAIKSRKIRLYPSAGQRQTFRRWHGAARFVYNQTLEFLKTLEGKRPAWTDIATEVILPSLPEWAKAIPFQIKKIAVKEACETFTGAKQKFRRTGEWSEMRFKSRKSPFQTCYIPKSAVKPSGIYPTIAGAIAYTEKLPDDFRDCELVYQQGRWYLCVPYPTAVQSGENQARIVALDPGIRTFQTFYSPDIAGWLGFHDFGRLVRLCRHLDNLISRYTTSKNKKQRYRMRKAANRLRWKIRDLRDELHAKTARFLVDHFDIILIPTFAVSEMAKRERRKLRAKSVRSMLTWAHSLFKERLKQVAFQAGKIVIEVNEAYTSKTCSWSGEVINIGSGEFIRGSDGIKVHRDMNGARGVFLRALAELPMLDKIQRALVNNVSNC